MFNRTLPKRKSKKAEKIEVGFKKINSFIEKGIKLSSKETSNYSKILNYIKKKKIRNAVCPKRKPKYFFKCGDLGHTVNKFGKYVPIPYTRAF